MLFCITANYTQKMCIRDRPFDVARGMLMLNGARLKVFREVTKCKGVSEPRPQPPTKIERRQG